MADDVTPPHEPVTPQDPATVESPTAGRRRLFSAMAGRPTRGQLIAAILLGLLGFALAVQLRANQEQGLSSLREQDLVRILDGVSARSQQLQQEVNELEATHEELTSGSGNSRSAIEDATKRADTLAILAGTAKAVGPGIEVTILDPKNAVRAARLLDAVQELRDAGAEAIQIGSVRIVASSSFVDTDDGIVIDGEIVHAPYLIRVIGDSRSLSTSLDIPGGIVPSLRQEGADAIVTPRDEVHVDALHSAKAPQYARPAPEATGGSAK